MIPVWISLIGSKLNPITTIFLGWFGPRGIASILYIFIVLEEQSLPGLELDIIYTAAMITVFCSILAHGSTAAPGANAYGKRITSIDVEEKTLMERKVVPEYPLRSATDQVQVTEIH
jgi:NhaP-type Na+/H+ or K+/H+ antiporter